jgi:hypothetical protein
MVAPLVLDRAGVDPAVGAGVVLVTRTPPSQESVARKDQPAILGATPSTMNSWVTVQ